MRKDVFKFDTNKGGAFLKGNKDYYNRLAQGDWYLVKDSRYPVNEEEADDAWRRAEARIGEKEYNLVSNNCEHFVTEILTGQGSSEQVEALLESSAASSTLGVSSAFFSTTQSSLGYDLMTLKNLMSAAEFAKVIEVATSTLDHELRYFRDHFSLTRFEKLAVDTADQASNIIDSWHRIFRF